MMILKKVLFLFALFLFAGVEVLHAQYVYVANYGDNTISAYSVGRFGALARIGTFPTGNIVGHPLSLAVDPLNRFVFVANGDAYTVTSYRIESEPPGALTLIGSFPTFTGFLFSLGPRPESVVVDPAGNFLYVAGRARADAAHTIVQAFRIESSGALTRIDEQIVPASGDSGILTNALAVDPYSRFLFLAGTLNSYTPATSSLAVFKILTTGVLRPVSTPSFPLAIRDGGILKGITVHPTGQWLYTVNDSFALGVSSVAGSGAVTPIGQFFVPPPKAPFVPPDALYSIALDPTGQYLYLPEAFSSVPQETDLEVLRVSPDQLQATITDVDNTNFRGLAVALDPTGRFVYVPTCAYTDCNRAGRMTIFSVLPDHTLEWLDSSQPATGRGPFAIATTSCTAPLPGTPVPPVLSTKDVVSPFTTSVLVNNRGVQELVTLSGSMHSVVQTILYGVACPAVTWYTHSNAISVHGVGPLSGTIYNADGTSHAQGTSLMPGTFTFPSTFRLTPANPQVAAMPIQVQSFVTLDANGVATDATTPPAGLVSWWKAEDNAADTAGNNPGTLHFVTFTPGRVGQAFDFVTSVDFDFFPYVEVASSASLQPPTVTVMAWVQHLGHPGTNQHVVSQGARACFASSYALYTGTGTLQFYVSDGTSNVASPDASAAVWDGNWHFVAGTYDGAAVRLYVDGAEVGAGTSTGIPINYAGMDNANFYIGAYRGDPSRGGCNLGFPGAIDEVRVFNRALTAPEIQALYQATR